MEVSKGGRPVGAKDQHSFINLIVEAVRKADPSAKIVVAESEFFIEVGTTSMHLGNVYRYWLAATIFKRRSVIDRYVAGFLETSRQTPIAREEAFATVVPVVRTRALVESILRSKYTDQQLPDPAWRPLGSHFAAMLVLDQPNTMKFVTADEIVAWNTTFEDLYSHGRQGLVATLSPSGFKEVRSGVFRSTYDNDYDTSAVFAPGVLKQLKINGDPIVAPGGRNTLLVCGSQDERAIGEIVREAIAAQSSDPSPMSARLLLLDGFTWVDYQPEVSHPAFHTAVRACYEHQGHAYAEQRGFMDEVFIRCETRDVYVAPYRVFDTGDDVFSLTLWVPDLTDTLIPHADRIEVSRHLDDEPFVVTAETLLEICGHHLTDTGDYPPRWNATTSPSAQEYDRLEARRIDAR